MKPEGRVAVMVKGDVPPPDLGIGDPAGVRPRVKRIPAFSC